MEASLAVLGRNVRCQRLRCRFTQEDLSERAGIHYTFLGQIERGRKSPSLAVLVKLAAALKVSSASLLRGVDAKLKRGPRPA